MRVYLAVLGVMILQANTIITNAQSKVELPTPPEQKTPWNPPTNIPPKLASAVEILFAQGFPDPRGCEYREIKVKTSGVWTGRGSGSQLARGWVLPEKAGATNHFAICWNGGIYPVEVDEKADLHTEALTLPAMNPRRFNQGIGETATVISSNATSTRILLLLRCGESEEALKIWVPDEQIMTQVFSESPPPNGNPADTATNYDPYLELAGDWAWSLFDQIISAHMRGDEALALAQAEKLAEFQPKVEAEADRRGFKRQEYYDGKQQGQKRPHLSFLDQLPEILTDLRRRAGEPSHVSVVDHGLEKMTVPQAQVRALIKDLDLVQARQMSQPGGVYLPEDPIMAALVKEGEVAVDPLLDCMEKDKRLTRSVGFSRDFMRNRTVLSVASAARAALELILHARFQSAAEARAYWNQNKGIALEERWYDMLKDDHGRGRWKEAAENITQPINVISVPGSMFSHISPADTNATVPMRGESLRGKSKPSVSQLMAKRALEMMTNGQGYGIFALHDACSMGLHLIEWDPTASVVTDKELIDQCATVMSNSSEKEAWQIQYLGRCIAKLTMGRAQAGDTNALKDYAAWIETTTPSSLGTYIGDGLEPMATFCTNAWVKAAADAMFGDTNSAWSKLPLRQGGFFDPVESGLVHLPAFRRMLAVELDKREVIGWVQWQAPQRANPGMLSYNISNHMNGGFGFEWEATSPPANGTKTDLRQCDWIMISLTRKKEIPFFNPFAQLSNRDDEIAKVKALLIKSE